MSESPLEMRFDPQTINHLGLRMYSTLPPALAEIISNSYDADAELHYRKRVERQKKSKLMMMGSGYLSMKLRINSLS